MVTLEEIEKQGLCKDDPIIIRFIERPPSRAYPIPGGPVIARYTNAVDENLYIKCQNLNGVNAWQIMLSDLKWVKKCEYLVFKKESEDLDEDDSYVCFKTIKRGNDVYCSRVRKSLNKLIDLCSLYDDIVFINEKSQRFAYTPFLFATLTYNRKVNSFENA